MKKALIITTVSGFVPQFEMNNVKILQELGYEVHYASNFHNPHYGKDNKRLNGTGIVQHQVDFVRSPFRVADNLKAYHQLKKVMKEEKPELIHCHTPMGGVLGRLAADSYRKTGTKVIYTAHGFHFFKGAPLVNWLLYYPVERILAHKTDVLITINEEDYQRARKFHLPRTGKVEKVDGVGIDIENFQGLFKNKEAVRESKRRELGISSDTYVFVSVGELTKRKNHLVILQALNELRTRHQQGSIQFLICGEGSQRRILDDYIQKNNLEHMVTLLGYREDVKEILIASDCFVFPSKQEGLPVALMEALVVEMPVLCSKIRGNIDLVEGENQLLDITSFQSCARKMQLQMTRQYKKMDLHKIEKNVISKEMKRIYGEVL